MLFKFKSLATLLGKIMAEFVQNLQIFPVIILPVTSASQNIF